jgi:hypothetical protein
MTVHFTKVKIIFLALFCVSTQIAAQKIITVDFCTIHYSTQIVLYDTIGIAVHVTVNDTSAVNDNTLSGDLFYWYATDSMIASGMAPRLINNNLNSELILDGGIPDTVYVDLRPEEIRTNGQLNVMCLWATMLVPGIEDTIPCCNNFDSDILGDEIYTQEKNNGNIVFPSPAEQYIFIRPEEISSVKQIKLISMEGKIINQLEKEEFKNGFISIEYLAIGYYLVELKYENNTVIRTKILKH